MRRLARLCEHDEIRGHYTNQDGHYDLVARCPGGEFLPEDALVIEKVDGEWPEWAARAGMGFGVVDKLVKAKANADALADQVGEPG